MPRHTHAYEPLFPPASTDDRLSCLLMSGGRLQVCAECGRIVNERGRGYADSVVRVMHWIERANEWRAERNMPCLPKP